MTSKTIVSSVALVRIAPCDRAAAPSDRARYACGITIDCVSAAMETSPAIPDYRSGKPLRFTRAAALKVRELVAEEGNPDLKLRVYINGGGCSGLQYGFTFDETQADEDLAVQIEGATLVCDPLSLEYLAGAQVDYTENLSGAQFVISNPNAKTTCGCGSSFTA